MTTIGVVVSFLLVGVISIAGKRGNAPTMVLTRATFGVEGAKVPAALSWIATLLGNLIDHHRGARHVLHHLQTRLGLRRRAEAHLHHRGGRPGGRGRHLRLRPDHALPAGHHHRDRRDHRRLLHPRMGPHRLRRHRTDPVRRPAGHARLLLLRHGRFRPGLGEHRGDYSRYLPRKSSNSGIVFWTTFGASIANVLLIFYGLLLAGSNAKLAENVGNDPIGAMASILPSGTSSRTPSSPCWASCPAPSWTTTPTDWHC